MLKVLTNFINPKSDLTKLISRKRNQFHEELKTLKNINSGGNRTIRKNYALEFTFITTSRDDKVDYRTFGKGLSLYGF